MLLPEQISEIHRLHWVEKWSVRKISAHLHIGRRTITKYLDVPSPAVKHRERAGKLDPFKAVITELLQQDPRASAPVILQRLQTLGYDGGNTIIKDYLRAVRKNAATRRAYVRVEPAPGERFDIDWGHFGSLVYNGATRKLYAFCLVESHSRKMYVEFTHSQSFETFVRCHIHAFEAMGGIARELWFDNLATAVAEHEGNLVRFNPRFLGFAREYGFVPRACHVAAAWEKGKVERAIGYVRQNFWPLRSFPDLADVNAQARQWMKEVANQRRHRETGQAPDERFQAEALRPLPLLLPDYRDTNRRRICSIKSSPLVTVTSGPRLLRPTLPSPSGATSSTTPPSPPRLPTASLKTPRSSCSAVTACAKPIRIRIRPPSRSRLPTVKRCAVVISRPGGVHRVTPQRRCQRERKPSGSRSLVPSLDVQLQRQSSAPALAHGMPLLCCVRNER
jgi:transposase